MINLLPVEVTDMLFDLSHGKRLAYLVQAGCDLGDAYLSAGNMMLSGLIFPTIDGETGKAGIPDTDVALLDEYRRNRVKRLAFTKPGEWDYEILEKEVELAKR